MFNELQDLLNCEQWFKTRLADLTDVDRKPEGNKITSSKKFKKRVTFKMDYIQSMNAFSNVCVNILADSSHQF